MKGFVWCYALVLGGLPVTLLGLLVDSEFLMAMGAGAIATVVVGWPVLVLAGGLDETLTSRRRR
jgi:hypothetical protein